MVGCQCLPLRYEFFWSGGRHELCYATTHRAGLCIEWQVRHRLERLAQKLVISSIDLLPSHDQPGPSLMHPEHWTSGHAGNGTRPDALPRDVVSCMHAPAAGWITRWHGVAAGESAG